MPAATRAALHDPKVRRAAVISAGSSVSTALAFN